MGAADAAGRASCVYTLKLSGGRRAARRWERRRPRSHVTSTSRPSFPASSSSSIGFSVTARRDSGGVYYDIIYCVVEYYAVSETNELAAHVPVAITPRAAADTVYASRTSSALVCRNGRYQVFFRSFRGRVLKRGPVAHESSARFSHAFSADADRRVASVSARCSADNNSRTSAATQRVVVPQRNTLLCCGRRCTTRLYSSTAESLWLFVSQYFY